MPSEQLSVEAYVLYARKLHSHKRWLKLFSRQHGVIHGIANIPVKRGKITAADCQPLVYSQFQLTGAKDLKTVTEISVIGQHELPYARIVYAQYINELLARLLPEMDQDQRLFDVYKSLLHQLAGEHYKQRFVQFQIDLLRHLGYLALTEVSAEALQNQQKIRYHSDYGLICASDLDALSLSQSFAVPAAAMGGLMNGAELTNMGAVQNFLDAVYRHVLGKELKSRAFIQLNHNGV